MVDRTRPHEPNGGAPIVLCCAHGEADRLAALVSALRDRGHVVELLEGIELEPRALAAVIETWRGGGLYVLCRGGAFDRDKIDAVREVLLAHRVSFGRVLTLPVAAPGELLERVDQSLRRMVAHLPPQPRGEARPDPAIEAGARGRRVTLMVTPPPPPAPAPQPHPAAPRMPQPPAVPPRAAAKPAGPPAPPPASEAFDDVPTKIDSAASVIEIDPALVIEDPSVRRRVPVDEELEARVDLDSLLEGIGERTVVAPAPSGASEPERGALSRSGGTLVAEAIPYEGYAEDGPGDADASEGSPSDGAQIGEVEIDGAEPGDVTQVAPMPAAAATVTTAATTLRRPTVAPQATIVAAAVDGRPTRWRLTFAAVVATLATGGLAATMLVRDDGTETEIAAVDSRGPTASETMRGREPADAPEERDAATDAAGPDTARPDATFPSATRIADATTTDAVTTTYAPDPDDDVASKRGAGDDATPTRADAPDLAPAPPIPDAAPPTPPIATPTRPRPQRRVDVVTPPRTRVLEALRARSIRALDVLLVTRRATAPMDQQAALTHCDGLDIAGLAQWRLPELGELASLTDAGLVGRGYYWSGTPADTFGDGRMAWNGGSRQASARSRSSAVICVRGDRGT